MPTIIDRNGYRVLVRTADPRPAHVHVRGAGYEVVFLLNCPQGPLALREFKGNIPAARIRRLANEIETELAVMCAAWRKYHGRYY
ncbi:hypothetical protein AWB68_08297 [Caballeronia choica]|jgi:hypothetical protein|uniref:DUF4160 domain-containing protein n=1 Tax=Caballeronia choica TaxID=326476 RepID=A0A158L198_9BURK|nr:DUF4160 domain-containing protein [Caballeronia choica]SAL87157.1 hypothetical protein AWB68_08297 [Caballeronia choica]